MKAIPEKEPEAIHLFVIPLRVIELVRVIHRVTHDDFIDEPLNTINFGDTQ